MEWNDLKVVLAISREKTVLRAAKSLGVNHSTVSRKLNSIEEKMGVSLFERLPDGYFLTKAGEEVLLRVESIEKEANKLSRKLMGKDLRLAGNIRVTAPEGISLNMLHPIFTQFLNEHPDVDIDLSVSTNNVNLEEREADLAIRVTNKPPEVSIGKRVCKILYAVYASTTYAKDYKNDIMTDYQWILHNSCSYWFTPVVWEKMGFAKDKDNTKVIFRSDSMLAILNAVKNGAGVSPLPCFIGDSDKNLVRVLEPKDKDGIDLWILMHSDLRHTTRVKLLMQFLYESLGNKKDLFEGKITPSNNTYK